MMKKLALVAAGFLCTGLLGACSNQGMESSNKSETKQTSTTGPSEQAGKKVQEFNLQGVDGKTYRLSDYKGKKVYLKFWASWCSICLSTLEDTNELAKEEAGKDYVVLSVVAPTSLDYKDFPVLLDSKGELLQEYGIRSYPSALFIASDGTLAKTHIGYMSKEDIVQTLKEMK